jgi:hypothetical protein
MDPCNRDGSVRPCRFKGLPYGAVLPGCPRSFLCGEPSFQHLGLFCLALREPRARPILSPCVHGFVEKGIFSPHITPTSDQSREHNLVLFFLRVRRTAAAAFTESGVLVLAKQLSAVSIPPSHPVTQSPTGAISSRSGMRGASPYTALDSGRLPTKRLLNGSSRNGFCETLERPSSSSITQETRQYPVSAVRSGPSQPRHCAEWRLRGLCDLRKPRRSLAS